ncbi:MAG TPA: hypothetical protein VF609_05755, partial [Flavisolibacter sp.]
MPVEIALHYSNAGYTTGRQYKQMSTPSAHLTIKRTPFHKKKPGTIKQNRLTGGKGVIEENEWW